METHFSSSISLSVSFVLLISRLMQCPQRYFNLLFSWIHNLVTIDHITILVQRSLPLSLIKSTTISTKITQIKISLANQRRRLFIFLPPLKLQITARKVNESFYLPSFVKSTYLLLFPSKDLITIQNHQNRLDYHKNSKNTILSTKNIFSRSKTQNCHTKNDHNGKCQP